MLIFQISCFLYLKLRSESQFKKLYTDIETFIFQQELIKVLFEKKSMRECILRFSLAHSGFRGLIFIIFLGNDLTSLLKWFKLLFTDSLFSTVTVNQAVLKTNRKDFKTVEKDLLL